MVKCHLQQQSQRLSFSCFLLLSRGSCTDLIPARWHRWSPHIPHRSSLTSAAANCRTALRSDSPSPAGKEIKYPTCRMSREKEKSEPTSATRTIKQSALLKDEGSFPRTAFWLCVYMWLVVFRTALLATISLWHCTRWLAWAQSSFTWEGLLQSK